MVREIGIHDDDEIPRCRFETMDVSGAKAEFAGTRAEKDVVRVIQLLELLGDFEGAVGGGIVDNDNFVIEVIFSEGAIEEPDYYWEVTALVVLGDLVRGRLCKAGVKGICLLWVILRYTCFLAPYFAIVVT